MRLPLTHRLNQILPKLTSNNFLKTSGIGNEIAFYIFDYAPEDELRIREHIRFLLDHLPKTRPGLRVAHVNLFDFLIDYLKERNLLKKSFRLQREEGNGALLKALKGILHEEKSPSVLPASQSPQNTTLFWYPGSAVRIRYSGRIPCSAICTPSWGRRPWSCSIPADMTRRHYGSLARPA